MRPQKTSGKILHHYSESLLLQIRAIQHLFIKEQIITDVDISILSRFININLKRLHTENNELCREFFKELCLPENTLIFKHGMIIDKLSRMKW